MALKIVKKGGGQKTPKISGKENGRNAIFILNKDLHSLELSPRALEGLTSGGFNNLKVFWEAVKNEEPLPTLGAESRKEIEKLFQKNKIALPKGWAKRQ